MVPVKQYCCVSPAPGSVMISLKEVGWRSQCVKAGPGLMPHDLSICFQIEPLWKLCNIRIVWESAISPTSNEAFPPRFRFIIFSNYQGEWMKLNGPVWRRRFERVRLAPAA